MEAIRTTGASHVEGLLAPLHALQERGVPLWVEDNEPASVMTPVHRVRKGPVSWFSVSVAGRSWTGPETDGAGSGGC